MLGASSQLHIEGNPVKIADTMWKILAKWYISFLDNKQADLIVDLADFHSQRVGPRELTVSTAFFNKIVQEPAFKQCPCLRHYLATTQYSRKKIFAQGIGPAIGQLLEQDLLEQLGKKGDVVAQTEKTIVALRAKYQPILQEAFDKPDWQGMA